MITKNDIEKLVVNAVTDIASMFEYSTTEKVIGMIGDYYHCIKMVEIGAMPNATPKSVSHGISNLLDVVGARGFAYTTNHANRIVFPRSSTTDAACIDVNNFTNTQFDIITGYNYSAYTGFVILEYTRS